MIHLKFASEVILALIRLTWNELLIELKSGVRYNSSNVLIL
jgi:hypothetical protein